VQLLNLIRHFPHLELPLRRWLMLVQLPHCRLQLLHLRRLLLLLMLQEQLSLLPLLLLLLLLRR
jgi:hypothetical protein